MITQEQIAKKLGVSRQLVSFALAGYPKISATSRQRILAAAQKMGYRPNPYVRALKKSRTGIVALWMPDQISSHYAYVAREMSRLLRQTHYELIISEVGSARAEQTLSHVPVDGVFAVDAAEQAHAHLKSPNSSVPVVSMGAEFCNQTDYVRVDLSAGTKEVMRHLIGSGYRRIVHATFMSSSHPYAERRITYTEAMRKADLKPEFFTYSLSEGQRTVVRYAIQEYVRRRGKPEAIFCHSDDVALGIYRGLCDLKLRVPEDVALVGCDGIQDTEYLECPITTLVQPVKEMCVIAWKFLENRLKHPELKRQRATLKPALKIRESSQRAASTENGV